MIRLLIVDDSALMRRVLGELFSGEEEFELAFARNGEEAVAALHAFRPDVVTLDINMPGMNGLECLDRIMVERPCPVVMVSSLTEAGAATTLEALELGAVDFVAKPEGAISLRIGELAAPLVEKVRAAAGARVSRSHRLAERVRLRTGGGRRAEARARAATSPPTTSISRPSPPPQPRFDGAAERIVLVGCSTGGPQALETLLKGLPAAFPWPIVVAQHMPASFTGPLARRLDGLCALHVVEVGTAARLEPGTVHVAKGDRDIILSERPGGAVVMTAPASTAHRWHPSVDRLVHSAIDQVGAPRLIGVLMTGMGADGAEAMARLSAEGGETIAEAEQTAVVWGMPAELIRRGGACAVEPLGRIAGRLLTLASA